MIVSRICREPGVTVSTTPGATLDRPRSVAATVARSSYELFTDDPTHTCTTARPGRLGDGDDVAR